MRIITFLLLICTFIMCKSKEVVPTKQFLNFVVVLEGETSPKVLKKDISFDLIDFKKVNKTLNQWALNFKANPEEEKKLRTDLLNHPKVISVVTQEQLDKMNLKNGKKAKVGPIGNQGAKKQ